MIMNYIAVLVAMITMLICGIMGNVSLVILNGFLALVNAVLIIGNRR